MISAHSQKSGVVNFTDTVQASVWSCFFVWKQEDASEETVMPP